jgi:uncharacterized protein (TIGR02145 family)
LKSETGWINNANGDNSSGFTGLPGGYRVIDFSYCCGNFGAWWTSSQGLNGSSGWYRYLDYSGGHVARYFEGKQSGFSVRCIKD